MSEPSGFSDPSFICVDPSLIWDDPPADIEIYQKQGADDPFLRFLISGPGWKHGLQITERGQENSGVELSEAVRRYIRKIVKGRQRGRAQAVSDVPGSRDGGAAAAS